MHYVPANRDPATELRGTARSRVGQLVRAISWDQETRDTVQYASESIGQALSTEQAVGVINRLLQKRWDTLSGRPSGCQHQFEICRRWIRGRFIRSFGVVFRPKDDGNEIDLSGLSEGQQSLFYLALVAAVFDVERQVTKPTQITNHAGGDSNLEGPESSEDKETESSGFRLDQLRHSSLDDFRNRKPENHLAPHYLTRIVALLRSLTKTEGVQALFSVIHPRYCDAYSRRKYGTSGWTPPPARPW